MQSGRQGMVYRCELCGAEICVIAFKIGSFMPRCCNRAMDLLPRRARFFVCELCGAELAVLNEGRGGFEPECCNQPMVLRQLRAA